jgi:hypothetical protein
MAAPSGGRGGYARLATPSGKSRESRVDRSTKYLVTDEELDALLEEMLAAGFPAAIARNFTALMVSETVTDAWCRSCNGPAEVRYPDWRGYRGLAELILNYLRGKPAEKKLVDVTHRLVRRREDLEALSDEELVQIEAGEWESPK